MSLSNAKRVTLIKDIKRIVIKVGSSTLTHPNGLLNFNRIESIVRQLSDLRNSGKEVILVSSGAVAAGIGKLGLRLKPETIPEKQAAAAIGQGILVHMYEKLFSEYGQIAAQILLTKEDFIEEERLNHLRDAFFSLLSYGAIPIINENDVVAIDELKLGDNDTLSAMVAKALDADLLILLSDIDGLYSSDPTVNPNATLINWVDKLDSTIESFAEDTKTGLGTGGMITKISAAKLTSSSGISMIIANGSYPNIINRLLQGKEIGTWFSK
ncbi:MAG: glutamate 5-kinase [Clostridiaceae bacterium]|nr:glutamate 5-kinase [Clostridiaceae bacterium]